MTIYVMDNDFDASIFDGASIAFGVFDGMHLGHQYLIGQTIATAAIEDAASLVLTFDRDPDEIFQPDVARKLMSDQARLEALAECGVDDVVVLPFTESLYTLEPETFLEQTFAAHAPAHLHIGSDFRFGARASGDVDTLRTWGTTAGTHIHAHDLLNAFNQPITATRIRALLKKGEVQEAATLLGHPYTICGIVEGGRGQGQSFGFATANLRIPEEALVVAEGVYAAYAWIEDEAAEHEQEALQELQYDPAAIDGDRTIVYKAALSVGVSPTFRENGATANMEVHLLGYEGDVVGHTLCVEFVARLRDMIKFDSTEELIAQVTGDIDWINENL